MPKIQAYKGGGGRITWDQDDFVGGLHPRFGDGVVPQRYYNNTIAYAESINPYRNLGCLSPGFRPVDAEDVSVVTDFLRQGVVRGDYTYIIEDGPNIHQVAASSPTFPVTSPAFHTITPHGHSTAVGNDMTLYTANVSSTPTICAFYSWNDNTDWDVGRYTFSAFDDDFMTTVPAGTLLSGGSTPTLASGQGASHPLVVGYDDVLYIGDNEYVHAYNGRQGANGTFYLEALRLPGGFEVTAFAKLQPSYLAVFAYRPSSFNSGAGSSYQYGEAICALWNTLEADPAIIIDLADNYVSEAIEYKSTIACFTQGRLSDVSASSLTSKLQLYNGSHFEPVATFSTDVPIRGGAEVAGDMIRWNSEGLIHAWGAPFPGLPTVLNRTDKGFGTNSGFLRTVNGLISGTLVSSGAADAGGLQSFRIGTRESTNGALTVGSPTFQAGKRGKVKSVQVEFAKTNSASNTLRWDLSLYDSDGGTMPVMQISEVTAQNLIIKRNFSSTATTVLPPFNEVYPVFSWGNLTGTATNAPIIRRIDVDYEEVNLSNT